MIHYFKIMTKIFSNFNWNVQTLGDHAIQNKIYIIDNQ